jgi:hypothetical protein
MNPPSILPFLKPHTGGLLPDLIEFVPEPTGAIVQRIVEEHGGTVSMKSSPPRGTLVSCTFPEKR